MVEPLSLFQVATGNRSRSMLNTDGFCFPGSIHQKKHQEIWHFDGSDKQRLTQQVASAWESKATFLWESKATFLLTYNLYS